MEQTTRAQIAGTILKQLGGSQFVGMTGAKDFMILDSGFQFSIPRANNIRRVRILLDSADLYTMALYSIRTRAGMPEVTLLDSFHGLAGNQLQEVFTAKTGLYTHL